MDASPGLMHTITEFLGPLGTFLTAAGVVISTAFIPLRSLINSRKDQDINAAKAFRDELRKELAEARKETEELRDKVMELFEKNLNLKHENANLQIKLEILTREVEVLRLRA